MSNYGTAVFSYLIKRVGKSPLKGYYRRNPLGNIQSVEHEEFLMSGENIHILTYIEMIIKTHHTEKTRHRKATGREEKADLADKPRHYKPTKNVIRAIDHIENVLITEGILWDINRLGNGGVIEFVPLESEGMKELDEDLQEIAEAQPWGTALRGYNDAFNRYLNGDFDEHIPKKLYYSIEEVLKTICVEEGWTDSRELTHADYLEMLNEHGMYEAHGVTATELDDLLDFLERMVAKVSDDRHQRHAYHDRTYVTLLLHQVGSYLYFLINRYKDYSS